MPTYSYRCKFCSNEFEELQRISDDPLVICPSCHKKGLVRLIGGGAGLVFKGSGFYLTDYKKQSGSGHSASSSKAHTSKSGQKTESKPDAKSDTKPDAKPDVKSEDKSGPASKPAAGSGDAGK